MNKNQKHLIIIRGNSGSGKSTLAKELRSRMVEKGLKTALIEQDYLRRIILKEKENEGTNNIDLIEQTVTFALNRGYSVILEGILTFKRYGTMLSRLTATCEHSHVYYMNVPFEETLRRHITKPNAHEFGETEMKQWWQEYDVTGFTKEEIIPAQLTLEQTVQKILDDIVTSGR